MFEVKSRDLTSFVATMMSVCQNRGSTARDYAMLERNILAHFKLALLLSLLSSSLIVNARFPGIDNPSNYHKPLQSASFPLAVMLFIAAIGTLIAGGWEYISNCADMQDEKAFLAASKSVSL